jgi:hypothetical protein
MALPRKAMLQIMAALEEFPSPEIRRPLSPELRLIPLGERHLDCCHDFAGDQFLRVKRIVDFVVEALGPDRLPASPYCKIRDNAHAVAVRMTVTSYPGSRRTSTGIALTALESVSVI